MSRCDPDAAVLAAKIERWFPIVPMPPGEEICFHSVDCDQCDYLRKDLEDHRGKPVDGDTIRYLHDELSLLSAAGFRWILPHYLRYCLTDEASYNQFETEYLIYSLSPSKEFENETSIRLSMLTVKQIEVLTEFLNYLASHPHWKEYCPDDIHKAISFLEKLTPSASRL